MLIADVPPRSGSECLWNRSPFESKAQNWFFDHRWVDISRFIIKSGILGQAFRRSPPLGPNPDVNDQGHRIVDGIALILDAEF